MPDRKPITKPICKIEEVFFLVDNNTGSGDLEEFNGPGAREALRAALLDREFEQSRYTAGVMKVTYNETRGLLIDALDVTMTGIKFSDEK